MYAMKVGGVLSCSRSLRLCAERRNQSLKLCQRQHWTWGDVTKRRHGLSHVFTSLTLHNILAGFLCTERAGASSLINEGIRDFVAGTGHSPTLDRGHPWRRNIGLAEAAIAPGKLDPEIAAAIRWGFLVPWLHLAPVGSTFGRKQAEEMAAAQVKKVQSTEDCH